MSDISSNDFIIEDISSEPEETSEEEIIENISGEENATEIYSTMVVDSSDILSNIANDVKVNNALLVAVILLIGILMGFKRYEC